MELVLLSCIFDDFSRYERRRFSRTISGSLWRLALWFSTGLVSARITCHRFNISPCRRTKLRKAHGRRGVPLSLRVTQSLLASAPVGWQENPRKPRRVDKLGFMLAYFVFPALEAASAS